MPKVITIDFVRKYSEAAGFLLLSTEFLGSKRKLDFICSKGHKRNATWSVLKSNPKCFLCTRIIKNKRTLEKIRQSFEKEGYTLLSKKYSNNKQKLQFICSNGHKYKIDWSHWQTGVRCFYCHGKIRKTFAEVKESFEKEGYILLSKKYVDAHSNLNFICPKGHKHSISWSKWHNGTRCIYCGGKARKNIKEIQKSLHKEGYKLLTTEYRNCDQKLEYICPKGHKHQISWDKWRYGRRCFECSRILMKEYWSDPEYQKKMHKAFAIKPNKPETILLNLLNQLFPNEYKYVGDFQFFLGGKNPDFVNINSQKKLIEIFGEYFHSPKMTGLSREEHELERIMHFKKFSFDTLILWENELKDQEKLVEKLQEFHHKQFEH